MTTGLTILARTPLISEPVPIFLSVMAIILVTPLIFNRLKIPNVIGMILAGLACGPHGFGLLDKDMSFEVFGQVGLLYLMFLAGIEIDMYHLKKNLSKGLVFGAFTFGIPLVIGAGVALTVLGSLIVLAGVLGVVREGSVMSLLRVLGYLIAYSAGIYYIYPRLTRYFFRKYHDGIQQFIYVMVMVFFAAALASWRGLEGVFGAFYAGLILNRFIPGRSTLMGRIEFVGNAIFIPYFLIGVGMLIDVSVIAGGWGTIYIAAVMSATAMFTKWLAALMTQKVFGLTTVDRSIMYQLSNAHTAVALAVVTIGYSMGLFDVEILNGTVVMILVTCSVSSVGTANAAGKLKVQLLLSLFDKLHLEFAGGIGCAYR